MARTPLHCPPPHHCRRPQRIHWGPLLLLLLVAACAKKDPAEHASGSNGDTDNNMIVDGEQVDLPGLGSGGDGNFNIPAPPEMPPPETTDPVVELPPADCMANEDCCPLYPDCSDAATYICTTENKCGKVSGACTTQQECQNDTYCCLGAECRKDGAAQGVCIPTNVPPFLECQQGVAVGVFAPSVQCQWAGPAPTDPAPASRAVLSTPLVADMPTDAGESAEIVVITTADAASVNAPVGVIRILSGQDCRLLASIENPAIRASAAPALADLDGDGNIDIVARRIDHGAIAFSWQNGAFAPMWSSTEGTDVSTAQAWDGVAVHDVNNDGLPEVLVRDAVYNGQTGALLSAEVAGNTATYFAWNGIIPIVGDFNADNKLDLVTSVGANGLNFFSWDAGAWARQFNNINGSWFGVPATHFAPADFDADGVAEIVAVTADQQAATNGRVAVYSLAGTELWHVDTVWDPAVPMPGGIGYEGGGPPVIADFDADGKPEIGVAGATRFRVFDDDCAAAGTAGCEAPYIRWSQPSQDASSRQTGASVFDFDGDNRPEAVYADECFLRVYGGGTGEVLYSAYRASSTWYESPVIADVDKDENTEIVVNNAYAEPCPVGSTLGTPYVDPLHAGVRCDDAAGCLPGSECVMGYCRCTADAQCCPAGQDLATCGVSCAAPPAQSAAVPNPPSAGDGNVCRATHPNAAGGGGGGIRVLRDALDRWPSSRPMWNQHAYSITNVLDDGKIPTGDWRNWAATNQEATPYNNFRQNRQGRAGVEDLPDITGRFTDDQPCVRGMSDKIYVQATVCNRGQRAVGAALPATFYLGDPSENQQLCTSYTDGPVPTGGCKLVYCEIPGDVIGQSVSLSVNQDATGAASTLECRADNNFSSTMVTECPVSDIR